LVSVCTLELALSCEALIRQDSVNTRQNTLTFAWVDTVSR
jgi:hypothetical protein